jgi:hypothetical protein
VLKVLIASIAMLAAAGAAASAPPTPAIGTLDASTIRLVDDGNGGFNADVGITNITQSRLTVDASVARCAQPIAVAGVPPAAHAVVTVHVPSSCRAEEGTLIHLSLHAGGARQSASVTANKAAAPSSPVRWWALIAFLVAFFAGLLLVGAVYGYWRTHGPPDPTKTGLGTPLQGLTGTWSFSDSIASSLTGSVGLVAVVLGSSDFLKAVLGPHAEAAIAVSTIAGAIALALVGTAGVVVLTLKDRSGEVTIVGLLAGTIVGLAAAGGQVWAVALLLTDLTLGRVAQAIVWLSTLAVSGLLIGYTWRSLETFLDEGTKAADPPPDALSEPWPNETVAAAILAVAELGRPPVRAEVLAFLRDLEAGDGAVTGRSTEDLPLSGRAALL